MMRNKYTVIIDNKIMVGCHYNAARLHTRLHGAALALHTDTLRQTDRHTVACAHAYKERERDRHTHAMSHIQYYVQQRYPGDMDTAIISQRNASRGYIYIYVCIYGTLAILIEIYNTTCSRYGNDTDTHSHRQAGRRAPPEMRPGRATQYHWQRYRIILYRRSRQ